MGVIAGVLALASTAQSYSEGKSQAKDAKRAQAEYNNDLREKTELDLKEQGVAKSRMLENVAKDKLQADIEFLQAQATARNTASAIGLSGGSFDDMLREMSGEHSQRMTDIDSKLEDNLYDMRRQSNALLRGVDLNLDTRKIQKPSALLYGVQAASQGYDLYNSIK